MSVHQKTAVIAAMLSAQRMTPEDLNNLAKKEKSQDKCLGVNNANITTR